ncbi:MAG: pyridoxal-phosphate dependent enzyme, partial [Bdellovibrionota bacterium]
MQTATEIDCRPRAASVYSPQAVLDHLEVDDRELFVVRDDLLPGGTKQRACAPFLEALAERGYTRFYYASPFAGFAQVALAYVCRNLGLECHLYCSIDPNARTASGKKHEFTRLAEAHGAKVTLVDDLAEAERIAYGASRLIAGAYKIPLGFDCAGFRDNLELELRRQWTGILDRLERPPRQLWIPVGSGTLASVFKKIVNEETTLRCVDVRVLSRDDMRIVSLAQDPSLVYCSTPETFAERVRLAPPIPS